MEHSLQRRGYPEWLTRPCHALSSLRTRSRGTWGSTPYSVQRLSTQYGACCLIRGSLQYECCSVSTPDNAETILELDCGIGPKVCPQVRSTSTAPKKLEACAVPFGVQQVLLKYPIQQQFWICGSEITKGYLRHLIGPLALGRNGVGSST